MGTTKNTLSRREKEKLRKRAGKGKLITLSDGTQVMEEYGSQKPVKTVYPKKGKDPEATSVIPQDAASSLKFPPPKKNKIFRQKWSRFIESIASRENFKQAHLEALEILCDLYVEYEELSAVIRIEGRTYETISRFGKLVKLRPEVAQIEKAQKSIQSYTNLLGLFPKKDHSTENSDPESGSWA